MLSSWKVLAYVSERHGKLKDVFDASLDRLEKVRSGEMEMTELEDNQERVAMRVARENQTSINALERIIGTTNFQDRFVLDKLQEKANAVCRILKRGNPIGTGFLISTDVIITNNHVIEAAAGSEEMLAEFNCELDANLVPKRSACFKINCSKFFHTSTLVKNQNDAYSGLDFTMIGLDTTGTNGEKLEDFKPVYLDGNSGKIIKGEPCIIIQHPNGLPKKIVLKDNAFFAETNTCIVYEADTLPGSSGAMVVALGTCEVIALHHSGFPRTDEKNRPLTKSGTVAVPGTPDHEIDWIGNEGIKVSKIIEALKAAKLPAPMENRRTELLNKSKTVATTLASPSEKETPPKKAEQPKPPVVNPTTKTLAMDTGYPGKADFLITAANKPVIIRRIETMLTKRYGQPIKLKLAMPSIADPGAIELFSFSALPQGNLDEEAMNLLKIPEILNAEADTPLNLNADQSFTPNDKRGVATESGGMVDDGLGKWDEDEFLNDYKDTEYVKSGKLKRCREWNWEATRFDKMLLAGTAGSPTKKGIRVVQFDTGFTDHSKVVGGFDIDNDFNFINNSDVATDPKTIGFGKQPGHGTRTGSILIGNPGLPNEHDGNQGLLNHDKYKLTPFRIAETVILIDRQKQLANALDKAVAQGYDIITMSMGLPPTIATAKMAKKAYDKGVIWCCAAGNEVQAVIAPAVFPGTIAVAASNPLDKIWKASSRGDTVDITAPGEDVYVPIWNKEQKEDFAYGNGTSYATPHIAAAAAYWLATYQKQLSDPAYSGWKRVEAFRVALKKSARRPEGFPGNVGSGILDANALMGTPPLPANELKYAYDGWNEHAFFATIQGYGQLLKTYWNGLHGWITGKNKRTESFAPGELNLSPTAQMLEDSIFGTTASSFESIEQTPATLLDRYQIVQSLVEQSAK